MNLQPHPDIRIRKLAIGREKAPLLVVDNFVAGAEQLVEAATGKSFAQNSRYYPGVRARAPLQYRRFVLEQLQHLLIDYFALRASRLIFSMCHYSLVTTPADRLQPIQRIPHIDSTDPQGLASIHYLFRVPLGGTAFYRHRATGFEAIDTGRQGTYFDALQREVEDADFPATGYINGDTPLFERIAAPEGLFNRLLVYRRNSLHSGSIDAQFEPDTSPATGRLSINSFIDRA